MHNRMFLFLNEFEKRALYKRTFNLQSAHEHTPLSNVLHELYGGQSPKFLAMDCFYLLDPYKINLNSNYNASKATALSPFLRNPLLCHHSSSLINLLNGWASARWSSTSTTHVWHTTLTTTGGLVNLHHDRVDDAFALLLLGVEFISLSHLVAIKPVQGLLDSNLDLLLVASLELVPKLLLLKGVTKRVAVVLEAILGLDLLLVRLILRSVLLGLRNHAVDIRLRKTTLLVSDGDLVCLTGRLIRGGHVQDTVSIDIEHNLDLWDTTWGWWDVVQVELTQHVVVLGHRTLTLENLDHHTRLIVSVGGEGLVLLGHDIQ